MTEPHPVRRDVVVVPVADARRLATLCAMVGVPADVLPLAGAGSAVVPRAAVSAGSPATAQSTATDAAAALSRLTRGAGVVHLTYDGDRVSGQRWQDGAAREEVAAGLLLSALPGLVSDLLTGTRDPSSVPDAATTDGLDRRSAARRAMREGMLATPAWAGAVLRAQRWVAPLAALAALALLGGELVALAQGAGSWLVAMLAGVVLLLMTRRSVLAWRPAS